MGADPTAGRPEPPRVVRVPGGVFTMGQAPIVEAEAPNPPHRVELSPFWIAVHPVTRSEYASFAEATKVPGSPAVGCDRPELPVVNVGFEEAVRYCAWAGGCLPTEAQWEFAARSGDGRRYPWGDAAPDELRACFALDWNRGGPSPIGLHPAGASPFGCQDMAGNVWEWCLDVFRPNAHLERERLGRDPCVGGAARVRALRGGCWRSIDSKLQAAYRNWSHEAARHSTIGFRVCFPG